MNGHADSGFGHFALPKILNTVVVIASVLACETFAQVNSGSDGRDGALNPAGNLVIDMADHPDGIYQYTSVTIPAGVNVSFISNSNNAPVVWLVQGDCVISGNVVLSGQNSSSVGGRGGPAGFPGGNAGALNNPPTDGRGPGGGPAASSCYAGNASFGSVGGRHGNLVCGVQLPAGQVYGSTWLIPLIGGSGGGGCANTSGGGGGGGAILIAASGFIDLNGTINSTGGSPPGGQSGGGSGSGGAVRLLASVLKGSGTIDTSGGAVPVSAGNGRVRLDALDFQFTGNILGTSSQGFQPIILPTSGQGVQLRIATVGAMNVPPNPSDQLANPAVIIPGQQANPVPIVVQCSGIPLNTPITLTVRPANGSSLSVAGVNDVGTQQSSTARVSMNIPRGGGIIFASTVIGIGDNQGASINDRSRSGSYAQTGLTTSGERFAKMEITTTMGGRPEIAYITGSGRRYSLAAR